MLTEVYSKVRTFQSLYSFVHPTAHYCWDKFEILASTLGWATSTRNSCGAEGQIKRQHYIVEAERSPERGGRCSCQLDSRIGAGMIRLHPKHAAFP